MTPLLRTILCLSLAPLASSGAQSMIAEINEPVETEFGLYTPLPVTIQPDAPAIDPGENLEHVENLADFDLNASQKEALKKNHFFVLPAERRAMRTGANGYNEVFDLYNDCRENNIPVFVTSDALLHCFHLCFDYILRTCEEKRFIKQLDRLLSQMIDDVVRSYGLAETEAVRTALALDLEYLIVAKKLLDPDWAEPINGGRYLEELELIGGAAGFTQSPLFDYSEDYSQYIVRGHYTRTDSLKRYFRSMMWLGRMTFACLNSSDPASREMTRSALLLVQAMARLMVDGRPALEVWDDVYQPTVFFVGKSDDINFNQYLLLAREVYGQGFDDLESDQFADEEKLTAFLDSTASLSAAAIDYPGQPSKGFRFMGQRFIPDSWVLDELVELKTPGRTMPTGLDVMVVLGSEQARKYLRPEDLANPLYVARLDSLAGVFADYPDEVWAQNAYWNWLYTLMPLLSIKGSGYPWFMRTRAWTDKDLHAALASWAELRHDTILYAKQSGTETGMPPSAQLHQGYVEPNPHFFSRLASLAQFMTAGLESRQLLFPQFSESLSRLHQLSVTLKTVAEKELTRETVTASEYRALFEIGKTLYDIVTFSRWPSDGPMPEEWDSDLEPMPVIADVHTDATSGLVLEEGVGYPYSVYVLVPVEGQILLTKGAGFSYYEFTWPMNDRLTDEKWRKMLDEETAPAPPAWTSSFALEQNSAVPYQPDFYMWGKLFTESLTVQLELDQAGSNVQVRILYHGNYGLTQAPLVTVEPPGAAPFTLEVTAEGYESWGASLSTSGLSAGTLYVEASAASPMGGLSLSYRTGLVLSGSSAVPENPVDSPGSFHLYPNWPNPFNPSTLVRFELPSSGQVTADIYNVNGRRVWRLAQGHLSRGTHAVLWDGRDLNGAAAGSGVYYLRLTFGDRVAWGKMLLLR